MKETQVQAENVFSVFAMENNGLKAANFIMEMDTAYPYAKSERRTGNREYFWSIVTIKAKTLEGFLEPQGHHYYIVKT